ncbi:hypothetical protein L3Q65_34325 [Amycolatopsis sp. FU40]|uniref:hypothetical protein n=1 Tax=Amycolatopsis sp. FU40 TaxID=2914159 RepID=UPI001F229FBC|nr:hypothetical protein [Amycolatopsis sp. FU40]UKD52944.1 hypothetical protein L3Q65_34325 [Amycolatopsis sp. FU40]
MTYPPQPGQGGDPYGQGWQQPGSGGVPQQPGWDPNQAQQPGGYPNAQQQPAWDPNAQQQYPGYQQQPYGGTQQFPQQGWDQGQYPGGPGGEPPKNNKTGLWIGIAVAVVVVVALGITGFVAPGFFLSKDDKGTTQAQPPAPAPSQSSEAPLPSDSSSPSTDSSEDPGSSGASGEAKQVIDDFLAKLNAKDAAGATAMACQGTESMSKRSIDETTSGDPQLTLSKVTAGSATTSARITGKLSGKDASGTMVIMNRSGGYCVGLYLILAF